MLPEIHINDSNAVGINIFINKLHDRRQNQKNDGKNKKS